MNNKRKITVFYDNTLYTFFWLQPLIEAKKYLKKAGYSLAFSRLRILSCFLNRKNKHSFAKVNKNKKFDIVFLAFHHKSFFVKKDTKERADFLKNLKKKSNKLVWLDCSDSTGTCVFDVLPFVDIYLKKQILKNKNLYCKKLLGQRLYTNYYSLKYGLAVPENESNSSFVEDCSLLKKIDVSWNISLWNNIVGGKMLRIKKFLSLDSVSIKQKHLSFDERTLNVFFNGSCPTNESSITYQRKRIFEISDSYCSDYFSANPILLSRKEYKKCMKSARYALSPFGWGEICNRDFEAFLYGSCLLKPSVEHIETFPNVYIRGVTYIPFRWDFSDFKDKVDYLLSPQNKEKKELIAKKGNELFCYYRKNKGKALAEHLIGVFQKHNI